MWLQIINPSDSDPKRAYSGDVHSNAVYLWTLTHTHTRHVETGEIGRTVSRKVHSAAGSLEPSVASPSPPKAVASCSCVPCHRAASSPSQHPPSHGPKPPLSRRPTRPTRDRGKAEPCTRLTVCHGGVPCHGANRARSPPPCPRAGVGALGSELSPSERRGGAGEVSETPAGRVERAGEKPQHVGMAIALSGMGPLAVASTLRGDTRSDA